MKSNEYTSAVRNWVGVVSDKTHIAVTLTMKQSAFCQKLDQNLATKNLRYFLRNLNRSYYGNAAQRYGKKLEVLAVLETSNWQRLHYHLLIKVPERTSPEQLTDAILLHWSKTDFAYNENVIKPCYSTGWINYMLKNIGSTAELDIENTNISR
jgi:hypothetical protein